MSAAKVPGSPGSHPHSDRRNWSPATTPEEFLRNIEEGLEERSERRLAKLMGWSRQHMRRVMLIAQMPDELFEICLSNGLSQREMAQLVEMWLRNDPGRADVERCPHCGGVLRTRYWWTLKIHRVVRQWLGGES